MASRDHAQTTTDGQGNPALADRYAALTSRELSVKAVDWCVQHGLTYRVECIDGIAGWRWDLSGGWPGRKYYHVAWRRIPNWLADRVREAAFLVRRFWVLRVRRLTNPYEAALVARRLAATSSDGAGTASTLGNSGMPEPSSPNLGDPDQ